MRRNDPIFAGEAKHNNPLPRAPDHDHYHDCIVLHWVFFTRGRYKIGCCRLIVVLIFSPPSWLGPPGVTTMTLILGWKVLIWTQIKRSFYIPLSSKHI